MTRVNISGGAPWESIVGYSRAVKVGSHVFVAGTTATDPDGTVISPSDAYSQTQFVLLKIEAALQQAGATLADVVRTRLFVTDITQWEAYGRAHGEAFRDVRPASTMVQVSALIDPAMLVEIEVDAVIGSAAPKP